MRLLKQCEELTENITVQATITKIRPKESAMDKQSVPHMHAYALQMFHEYLKGRKTAEILDVGCGSGYLLGGLAHLSKVLKIETFSVTGLEYVPSLVEKAEKNVKNDPSMQQFLKDGSSSSSDSGSSKGSVKIVQGDGWVGFPGRKFDVIHVGAAAATLPNALVEQLAPGGVMMIPVGSGSQVVYKVTKDSSGKVSKKSVLDVRYVPLVNPKKKT